MLRHMLIAGVFGLSVFTLGLHAGAAVSLPVGDSSFEDVFVAPSSEVADGPGTWAVAYGDGYADAAFEPATMMFPNQEGDYMGNIFLTDPGNFAALYQDVVRIEEGTYTFTVGVGHEPDAEPTSSAFKINFEATGFGSGTVFLEENIYSVGTANSAGLTDVTATLVIGAGHPEIGRNLRPVLLMTGSDAGSNPLDPRASYMLDNVRLDVDPAVGSSHSIRVGQPSFDPAVWNTPAGSGGNVSLFQPTTSLFPSQSGDQLGVLTTRDTSGSWSALWQDTDAVIEEGTFSLTVGVAHDPDFAPTSSEFRINFESVSSTGQVTLLGENVFAFGSANSTDLTDLTATLEIPSELPNVGDTLRLVLISSGADAGANGSSDDPHASYLVDNVRLEFEAAGDLLVGDYNGNGIVDAADYTVWRDTLDSTTELAADGDGNGTVDAADYGVWTSNFGNSSSPETASVPEPSALLLATASLLSMCGLRRRAVSK